MARSVPAIAILFRNVALAWVSGVALAQQIGVDICACQPAVVQFRIKFKINCVENTVQGPGIAESACIIESRDNPNVVDEVPVFVQSVQILELGGATLSILDQTTYTDGYLDGSNITYTSIVKRAPDNITAKLFPRALQVTLIGRNALQQDVTNQWIIVYNNNCGEFPVLKVRQQIGWSVFTELGLPGPKFCPKAVPTQPTTAPIQAAPTTRPKCGLLGLGLVCVHGCGVLGRAFGVCQKPREIENAAKDAVRQK